ncbi:tetratricopeptide repeat protein [Hazenella sp. IB182353]|uniref:helix-turn-helix domain-containing protein n=1 Tax=Polycladospora coralii TaxID=2771432 RepID=UPI001747D23E|nr:helix-turn-helix transcriptional regulator [Polycladospora coralii]MBS7531289.1 tetratricopeptide repeat protein [Polycladospora coralii]
MLGNKIKEMRKSLGMSQSQLGGTDMTRAYISMIEKGNATPSHKALAIIAERLGKPIQYFLEDKHDHQMERALITLNSARQKIENNHIDEGVHLAKQAIQLTTDPYLIGESALLIGYAYFGTDLFKDALQYYKLALPEFMKLAHSEKIVSALVGCGSSSFKMQDFKAARHFYEKALTYISQNKKQVQNRVQVLTYLGTTCTRLGEADQAIQIYKEALDEAQYLDEPRTVGMLQRGLGGTFLKMGKMEEAMKYTRDALHTFEHIHEEEFYMSLHNLAIIESSTGFYRQSYENLAKCLQYYQKTKNVELQAYIMEEMAIYWFKRGNDQEAKQMCNKTLLLLENDDNYMMRANLYRLMGKIHHAEGEYDTAHFFLRMSYDSYQNLHLANEADKTYKLLSEVKEHLKSKTKKIK